MIGARHSQHVITANVAAIRERIAAACHLAGRDPCDVTLVAVTKYVTDDVAAMVLNAGVADLAESRPQALWEKAAALACRGGPLRWHMIGHLQRNKLRRTLPLLGMLQSLDSLRLLEAIEADATPAEASKGAISISRPPFDVLVEVNLTDDPGRSGAAPDDVPALVMAASCLSGVCLRGLMGMAARPDAGADARRDFARLRQIRDDVAHMLPRPECLADLSMGMSGDFEAGILEGSTIVRIGSALFDGLE